MEIDQSVRSLSFEVGRRVVDAKNHGNLRLETARIDIKVGFDLVSGRLPGPGSGIVTLAKSGYLTYIITTRRMTSSELLRYRNGLFIAWSYHCERHHVGMSSDNARAADETHAPLF
jgi:hypothetical protein